MPLPRRDGRPNPRGYGISRLYTSPMWRALQTGKAIGRALGLRSQVWIDIHEQGGIFLDHGEERGLVGYPGMTRQEMLAECPDLLLPEAVTDRGWWTAGYEDISGCWERARKVAARLQEWAPNEGGIAIVTHGGFIDALLKTLLDESLDGDGFYVNHNTAISRLDFGPGGQLQARYLNSVPHLPVALVS